MGDDNKYWSKITRVYLKQRHKGLAKYGQPLEENNADIIERLNNIEEELIDALMYIEWIKEKFS